MCIIDYVAMLCQGSKFSGRFKFAILYLPLYELEQSCNPNVYLPAIKRLLNIKILSKMFIYLILISFINYQSFKAEDGMFVSFQTSVTEKGGLYKPSESENFLLPTYSLEIFCHASCYLVAIK